MDFVIFDEIAPPLATNLKTALDSNPANLSIRLHSPGGSVIEGLAAIGVLQASKVPVEVRIDGLAASMASAIAATATKVVAHPQSMLMIHRASLFLTGGNAEELASQAEVLDKVDGILADIYAAKTGKTKNQILKLMTAETWFTAQEAKDFGLVDEILQGGNLVPQNSLFALVARYQNTPESLKMPGKEEPEVTTDLAPLADDLAAKLAVLEGTLAAKTTEFSAQLLAKDAKIGELENSLAEAQAKLASIAAAVESDKRKTVVSNAQKAGKWLPIFDKLFVALDADGLAKLVGDLPVLIPAAEPRPKASASGTEYSKMSEAEKLELQATNPELFNELHTAHMASLGY